MEKSVPKTEDITSTFHAMISELQANNQCNIRADGFNFTDTSSEHEVFEKRSDFYHKYPTTNFNKIIEKTEKVDLDLDFFIGLYDELLFSELCFLEGHPIFNSYYNCIFFHNIDLLKKNDLLFSMMGTSILRLKKLFEHIYKGGVLNNDDFCFSYIPFNSFFEEERLTELLTENEKIYKDSNLKVKSKFIRKEIREHEILAKGRYCGQKQF